MTDELEPLPLPLSLPLWEIAEFEAYRAELHGLLGTPHLIDPEGNGLGVEHAWGFALKSSGQRLLVILYLLHGLDPDKAAGTALLHADPPDLAPILAAMGIEQTDPRVTAYPPTPLR